MFIGIIGVGVFFLSYYSREIGLPSVYESFCCLDDRNFNLFTVGVPFFIFSVFFVLYNNDSFKKWKNFTFIYLFILLYQLKVMVTSGFRERQYLSLEP